MNMFQDNRDVHPSLVGEKIWLAYGDHNCRFDESFTAQYCTVINQYPGDNDDWYLIRLEIPVEYDGSAFYHLLITSRHVGCRTGAPAPTSVYIFLISDPDKPIVPKEFRRQDLVAWGESARTKEDLERLFG